MCGIAGFWAVSDNDRGRDARAVLTAMADAIRHRGPDGEGYWQDPSSGVGLAHRRLSIIDLSEAGKQPMQSNTGRYVIVFNGEIYNFRELRKRLEDSGRVQGWRGHSDTEVLLAAIEAWGLIQALQAANGMFALALWDRETRRLSLARDRLGEKPLYYGGVGRTLAFASELTSIRAVPGFRAELNERAVSLFLQLAFIPHPLSIFKGIFKLAPASIATFSDPTEPPRLECYWDFGAVTRSRPAARGDLNFAEATADTERVLRNVVASQMVSDVPLGAFLSGGVDSSLVTALMQSVSPSRVKTYSIGFDDARFDETQHARDVAAHLDTEHTELRVTERSALDLVPNLFSLYDEPFADPSQLPTALLSRLTREGVTVALSGDGGDEVFAGYNRHILGPKVWNRLKRLPRPLRSSLAASGIAMERASSGSFGNVASRAFLAAGLPRTAVDKLTKFASVVGRSTSFEDFYCRTVSIWPDRFPLPPEFRTQLFDTLLGGSSHLDELGETTSRIMALDTVTYLPDDIMVKVDRASMSASLETRAPFLDARVVEHAWSLPEEFLTDAKHGKLLLKAILRRYVPNEIIDRPKQGFAMPLDKWLRGELREWATTMIGRELGHLPCGDKLSHLFRGIWAEHLSGRTNHGPTIWAILALQAWLAQPA